MIHGKQVRDASIPPPKMSAPLAVAYAPLLSLDTALASDFVIGALTGDCVITLANAVAGRQGTITVQQSGGAAASVLIVAPGFTRYQHTALADLEAASEPDAVTVYWYELITVAGVPMLLLECVWPAAVPNPQPSEFLSDLLVWIDPAYCTISLSKISSFLNRGSLGGSLTQPTASSRATRTAANVSFLSMPTADVLSGAAAYPLPALGALSAAECFVVGVRTVDPPTGTASGFQQIGSCSEAGHVPFTDRALYGEFCTTLRKTTGVATGINFAAPWLIDMWSAANDWGTRINRAAFYSTAANTFGIQSSGAQVMFDGRDGGRSFLGSWAAYLLCGSKQSPAQRTQLEDWALATYGV